MAVLTFSRPCWTLMVVVVVAAVAAFTFADPPITRHTGMNVTLDFPVPSGTTSAWLKRSDSNNYIFYCRDGHPTHPLNKEESLNGRVQGMDCDKLNDTFSVTVSNLTPNDTGLYEFHGVDSDGRGFNETIILNVTDPGPTGGTTEDGRKEDGSVGLIIGLSVVAVVVVVVVVVAAAAVGFVIYRRRTREQSDASAPPPPVEMPLLEHVKNFLQLKCESPAAVPSCQS